MTKNPRSTRAVFLRMAVQNLGRRPTRTFLLVLTVAVGTAALFASATLLGGISTSLRLGLDRLGADMLVVPRDTLVNLTSALLTVEPTPHLLDRHHLDELTALPGVRRVAAQRIFRTPAQSNSCNHEVDLIAFELERDFTVLPWLADRLSRPMRPGDVLVGGRRSYQPGEQLEFYGQPLTVYGRLERTGVGTFDHAFFITFQSVSALAQASQGKLVYDPTKVSALLVQLEVDASPETIRFAAGRLPDIKVVGSGSILTSVRTGLTVLFGGVLALALLLLPGIGLLVGTLFSATVAERRRELGLLLALGVRRGHLLRLMLIEAALATGAGAIVGALLGGGALLAYRRSLVYSFEVLRVPYHWPDPAWIGLAAAICTLLTGAVGLIGAFWPAYRTGRHDPFELIRGEGL